MSEDIVAAALRAATYADAIMCQTVTGADAQSRIVEASRKTAIGGDIDLPPDEPHDDWRPIPGFSSSIEKWCPATGETHAHYRVFIDRSSRTPSALWRSNHNGVYQGVRTVTPPGGEYTGYTGPMYSQTHSPGYLGHHETVEEAKAAAEKHFAETYRSPKSVGDYDLDSIMDEHGAPPPPRRGLGDDEDYSRIFDAVRRALRQATAALRRVAFTGDSDWKIDQWGNHECRLENGHVLYCTQVKSRPEVGWQWGIYDRNHPDPEVRASAVRKGGQRWGGDTPDDPQDHLPTAEHARRQAEQEYQKMFPLGTSTGGHKSQIGDSGVDYEKLINPRDDLGDEDYGHIFGMHRRLAAKVSPVNPGVVGRIAAELFPPCPGCNQVAGFDPHPTLPSMVTCRNCKRPMFDEAMNYLIGQMLGDHDRAVRALPETDHPTLGKHGQLSYEDAMAHIDRVLAEGEPGTGEGRHLPETDSLLYEDYHNGPVPEPVQHEVGQCRNCGNSVIKQLGTGRWLDRWHFSPACGTAGTHEVSDHPTSTH